MGRKAIEHVLARAQAAKDDSQFTYFFSLLLAAEALAKTVTLGMIAAIGDDKDRNRYRLEHQLARSNGLGDWGRALEDAVTGTASQYLLVDAADEQSALSMPSSAGTWQYDSVMAMKQALDHLNIDAEDVPKRTDMKRWFRLFATFRNKTRAHGATSHQASAKAAEHLSASISLFYGNFRLFTRDWAYLYRNLSGKYRVSEITDSAAAFNQFKQRQSTQLPDGVYYYLSGPRKVPLIQSDPELQDFYFANGGLKAKTFEMLSYFTDDKIDGDAGQYSTPPGTLPPSDTEGHGELLVRGHCFSNAPDLVRDYVPRQSLELDLEELLLDDKRPIVTLVGRGGIGKTSLALKVISELFHSTRYIAVVWLSARDVDLQLSGPKSVRPLVSSPDEMSSFYASLVLSPDQSSRKKFNPRSYFELQLQKCDLGPCLFVFDNFETTQNPIEMFRWIDTHIRLPNKALITTRLRDFKGDYPVEVQGMSDEESRTLVEQTSASLKIAPLLSADYKAEIISKSEGHPYVIKILLGDVAKARRAVDIPRLVAGSEDILVALFERTYAALSACAQRAFLTLAAWNSPVPRLALEAVLYRSTDERLEVESGIESLLQFSMAESTIAPTDGQEFISLPLVASVFGRKKLAVSPSKALIQSDVEILQMLGPSRRDDIHLGLAKKLERFLANVSSRVEKGTEFETFEPIIEMICRAYNPGWLLLARWHMESGTEQGYEQAKNELRRFLENSPPPQEAAHAWQMLGHACYRTGDAIGEIHAYIERAQLVHLPFHELSNAANRFNQLMRGYGFDIDREHRRLLGERLAQLLHDRHDEAEGDDLSRMAWLSIHLNKEAAAREYVTDGLQSEPDNYHLGNLAQRLGISAATAG